MTNSDDDREMSIVRPSGASVARRGFGSEEIEVRRETQGNALAARQQAEVQARYIVAMQRPRNLDEVRIRLLSHCKRRGFADKSEYAKPVGRDKVVGPTIRFVETALQEYGNVMPDSYVTYDDDERRIIRVTITDLERNITYADDAVVEKVIERKELKGGDVLIRSRANSYGGTTHVVRANNGDSELENKFAAEVSKKTRKLGLRILPADLVDEAIAKCRDTKASDARTDPDAERKRVADAFASLGVLPTSIESYLGHPLSSASPAEMVSLREAYIAVAEGHASWQEFVDLRRAERGDDEDKAESAKSMREKIAKTAAEARAARVAESKAKEESR